MDLLTLFMAPERVLNVFIFLYTNYIIKNKKKIIIDIKMEKKTNNENVNLLFIYHIFYSVQHFIFVSDVFPFLDKWCHSECGLFPFNVKSANVV